MGHDAPFFGFSLFRVFVIDLDEILPPRIDRVLLHRRELLGDRPEPPQPGHGHEGPDHDDGANDHFAHAGVHDGFSQELCGATPIGGALDYTTIAQGDAAGRRGRKKMRVGWPLAHRLPSCDNGPAPPRHPAYPELS
jgi:hypothetical protein